MVLNVEPNAIPSIDALLSLPRDPATLIAAASRRFTIRHPDGEPYITRWVLLGSPALEDHDRSAPLSLYVHQIHTADGDRHLHNHPWAWSAGIVLAGAYTDRRALGGRRVHRAGDLNLFGPSDYHSVIDVEPNTFTLFAAGREIQDWGFLVDGAHVDHREYFKRPDARQMFHTEDSI